MSGAQVKQTYVRGKCLRDATHNLGPPEHSIGTALTEGGTLDSRGQQHTKQLLNGSSTCQIGAKLFNMVHSERLILASCMFHVRLCYHTWILRNDQWSTHKLARKWGIVGFRIIVDHPGKEVYIISKVNLTDWQTHQTNASLIFKSFMQTD
jgi:hypothetical protein